MYFVCLFESLTITTVLNTGTLFTVVPFVTAVISYIVLREKIALNKTLVYFIGTVGTIWVGVQGNNDLLLSFNLNNGDLLFLICLSTGRKKPYSALVPVVTKIFLFILLNYRFVNIQNSE